MKLEPNKGLTRKRCMLICFDNVFSMANKSQKRSRKENQARRGDNTSEIARLYSQELRPLHRILCSAQFIKKRKEKKKSFLVYIFFFFSFFLSLFISFFFFFLKKNKIKKMIQCGRLTDNKNVREMGMMWQLMSEMCMEP